MSACKPGLRGALADLKEAFKDLDGIAVDMLRPPRRRELGPVIHERNYSEARASLVQALALATALAGEDDDGDDHGDPSGSGGAGPTH